MSDPDKGRAFNKDGTMTCPDGKVVRPKKLKQTPSSNGITEYTTTLWDDNYISCSCPGWAIKKGGPRTCKHTKASIAGNFADMQRPAQIIHAKMKGDLKLPDPVAESDDRMVEL